MTNLNIPTNVTNKELIKWVTKTAEHCQPDNVYWCDGSQEEYDRLCEEMVEAGTFIRLNEEKRPNSFLARSHPQRCGACRRPDLYLLDGERRCRTDQ